jgi:uncharacterized protein (TIGR00369 family)
MATPNEKFLARVTAFFQEEIPFNRQLGMVVDEIEPGRAVVSLPFRPEFVGDVSKGIVHGGVISTLIDATGGATAFSVLDVERGETSLNTVDMRVDYLRMGRGERFIATGTVIRKGNRICVTRIEVTNDEGVMVALGTAAYTIFSQDGRA